MTERKEYRNPFKPTAGMTPPVLVGRSAVLADFVEGIENGPGAPGRLMRITGPRGSGKTVLLNELASEARRYGWTTLDVVGGDTLCEDVRQQLVAHPVAHEVSVNVSLPFVSAEATRVSEDELGFRTVFENAVHSLTRAGRGLLVTVDEVQDAPHAEMSVLAQNVQLMIREAQNVAFVFAGLTTGVLDILNGKAMTFLRRAKAEELDAIPLDEVRASLKETVEATGFAIADDALGMAAEATAGYAYLIQLVGYYTWRATWLRCRRQEDGPIVIGEADARVGIAEAMHEFDEAVHEPAIAGLTRPAIDFLLAMADGPKVMSVAAIAAKLGKPTGYFSPYRRKLVARQVIESTAPGYVTFSIPFTREFLQAHRVEILARYGA